MFIFQSILLGVVQGLTEFLPVSSSAHLILVPKLFGLPNQTLFFDTALHTGTAFAVILYFIKDWIRIVQDRKYLLKILVGVLPAGIVGFLFNDYFEKNVRSLSIIILTLIIGTIVMAFSEKVLEKEKDTKTDINLKDSFFIGLMQVLALFPGMSRSGMTISGGFLRKIKKEYAVRFSFYLSAPIIFAAALFNFLKSFKIADNFGFLDSTFVFGFIASFLVGLLAIKFMLKYIGNKGFKLFIIYRVLLALLLIILCINSYPNI